VIPAHQTYSHPTKFINGLTISVSAVGSIKSDKERSLMAKKLYKCFACGKIYEDEQSAGKCHNAPIQRLVKQEDMPKPRFLGN
jgi:DNA-directed RNA polymerase subunit RPC12/RpoP